MKKLISILLALVIIFLLISLLIPVEEIRSVSIQNSIPNTVAALRQPALWRSKDSGVHTRTREAGYMNFIITEHALQGDSTEMVVSVSPEVARQHDPHNTNVSYVHSSSLFRKIFGLSKQSPEGRTVAELQSYLQDSKRFYGFVINTSPLVDSFFLTKKMDLPAAALFSTLPAMVKELEAFAAQNSCHVIAHNLAITPMDHDSLSVMAGLNIDKSIPGDYIYNFRQLPSTLGLLVGRYEGRFGDRAGIYSAMEKFITDHELAKRGIPFERYPSSMPVSDTSVVKFDLIYPVTYR